MYSDIDGIDSDVLSHVKAQRVLYGKTVVKLVKAQ